MEATAAKVEELDRILRLHAPLLVAYSGGVDSAFLLWRAVHVLGTSVSGALADSPSLKRSELEEATTFAREHGLPVRVVRTTEVEDPRYQANPLNRCYFCKHELFGQLHELAQKEGFRAVAYGENADDAGEFRPGQEAAREFAVLAPLRDAGLTKAEIRTLAREAGLGVADKPAQPCLASRIPTGLEVTPEKLRRVEAAESLVSRAGFRIVRVRHLDRSALVQVSPLETPRLLEPALSSELRRSLLELGFDDVAFDPTGYQGASLR
ncbi:MAG: ATP-dependent sacrificial sulfur transferase LarE [Candidatus Methylacidiphilales bacterium]|nr:ATP-dependent sacrificial sulfur transferase LarE [Candidatus Methylacidiphilales bacterium]